MIVGISGLAWAIWSEKKTARRIAALEREKNSAEARATRVEDEEATLKGKNTALQAGNTTPKADNSNLTKERDDLRQAVENAKARLASIISTNKGSKTVSGPSDGGIRRRVLSGENGREN